MSAAGMLQVAAPMKLRHVKLMSCKLISCYCILYNQVYDILNTCKTGMGEVISVAIYSTAARLGYASLKPCQENAVRITSNGIQQIF